MITKKELTDAFVRHARRDLEEKEKDFIQWIVDRQEAYSRQGA